VELFSSGNLAITSNNSTSLTNLGGNSSSETANMNNLSNPMEAGAGNLTLTENSSDRINVSMEEVRDSDGNLVGRIACYVDDELTKANINGATDNRTTLNVSTPRSLSLSALTSNNSSLTVNSTQISLLQNIINGGGIGNQSMTNWSYFFRSEQLSSNQTFNATSSQLAQISVAPLSDFHLKYTPWGAERLHINDTPIDASGATTVYDALSSPNLTNIYGQNFNDKYGQGWSWYGSNTSVTHNITMPVNGLMQVAANILQMRAAGTAADIGSGGTGGYNFTGNLAGSAATFPPNQVLAQTPFAVINEFGFNVVYNDFLLQDGRAGILVYLRPTVEFYAPFANPYGNVPSLYLEVNIKSVKFTVQDMAGRSVTRTVGPYTLTKTFGLNSFSKAVTNSMVGDPGSITINTTDSDGNPATTDEIDFRDIWLQGGTMLSQQVNCFKNHGQMGALYNTIDLPWRIVGNVTVEMGDIKLYAGNSPNPSALRDWIPGSVINAILGNGTEQTDVNEVDQDLNDSKLQIPKPGTLPTSFQIRQPVCSTMFYERASSVNFLSANITSFSQNASWPVSVNSTLSRISNNYSDSQYNIAYANRHNDFSLNGIRVRGLRDSYGPCVYTVGGITKNCTVVGTTTAPNPATPGAAYTVRNPGGISAALQATVNYGNVNGWENATLQRIDPRVRGYGNSPIGYSNFVAAPCTFSRNATYPALLYNGGGNNNSNTPAHGCNTYYGNSTDDYGIQGIRIQELQNRDIPADPSTVGLNEPEYFNAAFVVWHYFNNKLHAIDSSGNALFNAPHDLGKVPTNLNWRTLRFMPRHLNEAVMGLIPDWAMLDVISFSSNNSTLSPLKIAPINPNGSFALDATLNSDPDYIPDPRNNLEALIKPLERGPTGTVPPDANARVADPYFSIGSSITNNSTLQTFEKVDLVTDLRVTCSHPSAANDPYYYFRGSVPFATSVANNIRNRAWSIQNPAINYSQGGTWGGNAGHWRELNKWPSDQLVLPGEITEISGVADFFEAHQYHFNKGHRNFKANENRLSAFFPGLTLQSNFFTIYAYAQALDQSGNIDSESLTKTLVEVEVETPATATTPAAYKVKKLYAQNIPLGQ
jgi:hypothetical protein